VNRRVAVLTTGGTISQVSGADGASRPGFDVRALLPEPGWGHEIEIRAVLDRPSKDIGPDEWQTLAFEVEAAVRAGCDGVVVLHGTDTLHYTAAALTYMLEGLGVPVVLTGAMIPGGDRGGDARGNLASALLAATSDLGEVGLVFGDAEGRHRVFRGDRVRKVHSTAPAAFAAVGGAELGSVAGGAVVLAAGARRRSGEAPCARVELEHDVVLVKVTPALTAESVQALASSARGLVVEGTGVGHVPDRLLPVLDDFGRSGRPVVICSQTHAGGEALGAYAGDATLLALPGLVRAGSVPSEAALVGLMCELGRGLAPGSLLTR
jgi:glutamyl-tRNA(Gln) amidotransferase subunit D